MTPELLQRVAKCAPEWMGAELLRTWRMDANVAIEFKGSRVTLSTLNDNHNAAACFLMMDAMEREGYIAALYPDFRVHQGDPLKYFVKLKRDSDGITMLATVHGGATRTEAIVNAFLECFEKEEA